MDIETRRITSVHFISVIIRRDKNCSSDFRVCFVDIYKEECNEEILIWILIFFSTKEKSFKSYLQQFKAVNYVQMGNFCKRYITTALLLLYFSVYKCLAISMCMFSWRRMVSWILALTVKQWKDQTMRSILHVIENKPLLKWTRRLSCHIQHHHLTGHGWRCITSYSAEIHRGSLR